MLFLNVLHNVEMRYYVTHLTVPYSAVTCQAEELCALLLAIVGSDSAFDAVHYWFLFILYPIILRCEMIICIRMKWTMRIITNSIVSFVHVSWRVCGDLRRTLPSTIYILKSNSPQIILRVNTWLFLSLRYFPLCFLSSYFFSHSPVPLL